MIVVDRPAANVAVGETGEELVAGGHVGGAADESAVGGGGDRPAASESAGGGAGVPAGGSAGAATCSPFCGGPVGRTSPVSVRVSATAGGKRHAVLWTLPAEG